MEKLWFIKRIDLFKNLSQELMNSLEENSFMKEFKKNSIITTPENTDYVYLVKSGKVILYREENGKRFITDILKEGEIFGQITECSDEYAQALTDTLLCMINKNFFEKLINQDINLNFQIRKYLGLKKYTLEVALSDIVFKPVEERLLSLLKRLSKKFGVETTEKPEFVKINIPLTHQNIADMIGSSRETVSNLLNKLKKENKIITERKFIYLKKDCKYEK